ncbi:MAG: hypothetical protein EA402_05980 [Planctomycetota bacterium]|nr:MAG: hypothetical protein EA402_05980 [Planctomycetota bacterium]
MGWKILGFIVAFSLSLSVSLAEEGDPVFSLLVRVAELPATPDQQAPAWWRVNPLAALAEDGQAKDVSPLGLDDSIHIYSGLEALPASTVGEVYFLRLRPLEMEPGRPMRFALSAQPMALVAAEDQAEPNFTASDRRFEQQLAQRMAGLVLGVPAAAELTEEPATAPSPAPSPSAASALVLGGSDRLLIEYRGHLAPGPVRVSAGPGSVDQRWFAAQVVVSDGRFALLQGIHAAPGQTLHISVRP